MAYKIEYTPEVSHRYPSAQRKKKRQSGKLILSLLVLAAALWIRLKGVPDFLIPGDRDITSAAASSLLEHVQDGMPVGEAVTVFCRQIIDGAGF